MRKRIALVHAYWHSMAPIARAFASEWPEAEVVNVLDEGLYADVGSDGVLPDGMDGRLVSLFRHCELSGAAGIVFTGATFGPAVDAAAAFVAVPVIKADEAMAAAAVAKGHRLRAFCTAQRALPIIEGSLKGAAKTAGITISVDRFWIAGAKDAIVDGRAQDHDRLVAEAITMHNDADVLVCGQLSMVSALDRLAPAVREKVVSSAHASVGCMRALLGD